MQVELRCREVRYRIEQVGKIDYEFESEALADFQYSISNGGDNLASDAELMKDF